MNPKATESSSSLKKIRGNQSGWLLIISVFIPIAILSLKVDGFLIQGPQNTTAHVGQKVTLVCITNNTELNLRWGYMYTSFSNQKEIYNGHLVAPKLSHVFTVAKDGKGKFELQFNASQSTAAIYVCAEPGPLMTLTGKVTLQNEEPVSNLWKIYPNQRLIVVGVVVALQMAIQKDWLRHLRRGY